MRSMSPGVLFVVIAACIGCQRPGAPSPAAEPSSGQSVAASTAPKGTTGRVVGVVRVSGPAAPGLQLVRKIPPGCLNARRDYSVAYREGEGRGLADALVAVTGYPGKLPARSGGVPVKIEGCSYGQRTFVVQVGQHLAVTNADREPYLPRLMNAGTPTTLVALPRAEPTPIFFSGPGRYGLVDEVQNFMFAEIFVVGYPTVAVTGLDGRFVIDGVPPGKVHVNALLPITMTTADRDLEVKVGSDTEVELVIPFDLAKWEASQVSRRAISPPSATPSGAGPASSRTAE